MDSYQVLLDDLFVVRCKTADSMMTRTLDIEHMEYYCSLSSIAKRSARCSQDEDSKRGDLTREPCGNYPLKIAAQPTRVENLRSANSSKYSSAEESMHVRKQA